MSLFEGLSYRSPAGTRVAVGHPVDDPYIGNPMSSLSLRIRNEGPNALEWHHDGQLLHRQFDTDVQALIDPASQLLIVIGHGCGNLDGAAVPSNGILITASNRSARQLKAPPYIESALSPTGSRIIPDGFSALSMVEGRVEIWISYWDGEWMERRAFDAGTGVWGKATAHLRVR